MARNYTARGGDAAGIGIDSAELQREFQKVVAELEKFGNKLDANELGKIQRRALFVTRDAMKSNITDFKGENGRGEFKVYRNGGVYAEITAGQLQNSIGIRKSRTRNPKLTTAYWVGPIVKGAFKDPEKGGWFAHFLNYGGLIGGNKRDGGGTQYKGKNKGFADRAKANTITQVVGYFTMNVKSYIEKTFNRSLS
jgi:hypothetical protein